MQLPVKVPGKADDGPGLWAPATHVDLDEALTFNLARPRPATVVIWGVHQQTKGFLSVSISNK